MRLTLDQHGHQLANLLQPTQHDPIARHEAQTAVFDPGVGTKLPHQALQLPQIMSRHSGKEMMHGLELQAAVDEIQPRGTVDIHGGAELALGERFRLAQVGGGHGPVGEGDLDVEREGGEVADEDKRHTEGPGGDGAPEEPVAENVPVAAHEGDFGRARPSRGAEVCAAGGEQVQPGEDVEVEAGKGHDWVVGVFLVGEEEGAGGVPGEGEVVVGAVEVGEERGRDGEEGGVLDVGVVVLGVWYVRISCP